MTSPKPRPDPLEEGMEAALGLGEYIQDRACGGFTAGLDAIESQIAKLVRTDPRRAVDLYETFIGGCHEKAEEVDDSSGYWGMFMERVFCGWIKARQAAKADPDDTAKLLLHRMDHDPHSLTYSIERGIVETFDRPGMAAFERLLRERFAGRPGGAASSTDGAESRQQELWRRRAGDILKRIYARRRNVKAYADISEAVGLTPEDCEVLAKILQARAKPADAMTWVERGLEIQRAGGYYPGGHGLAEIRRALLAKLGRSNEALDEAWAEYQRTPSTFSYETLMKYVPKKERRTWHEKAMGLVDATNLQYAIELLLKTKETERLLDRLRRASDADLEAVSHCTTEPIARQLEKDHPDLTARLWRAQGMRIVKAGKSRYYEAANANFASARRCYERAGQQPAWEALVREIGRDHGRRTSLMPGFEAVVKHGSLPRIPSFVERAKKRWMS